VDPIKGLQGEVLLTNLPSNFSPNIQVLFVCTLGEFPTQQVASIVLKGPFKQTFDSCISVANYGQ
jgi:hypothetical protein